MSVKPKEIKYKLYRQYRQFNERGKKEGGTGSRDISKKEVRKKEVGLQAVQII